MRPKFTKMDREARAEFAEKFPFSAPLHELLAGAEAGTGHERKLIEQFFRGIGSPVATSTNRVYLASETDMTLLKMGMYR